MFVANSAAQAIPVAIGGIPVLVSAQTTTSGGVVLISVNTSGASEFTITNFGSINVYVVGSFDGTSFLASTNVYRQMGGGAVSAVEAISASTFAKFNGPFVAVRVVANSGSGVYRANLTYR